jgi:YD repeat-containing protein
VILLLVACHAPDSVAYADLKVTTRAFHADGAPDYVRVQEYDEQGRWVVDRWSTASGTEDWEMRYDGDCLARIDGTRVHPDEVEALSYDYACDEMGEPVRLARTYVDRYAGTEETLTETFSYANGYDAEGRLVRVADTAADGTAGLLHTFGWGGCDAPVSTAYESPDGSAGLIAQTCRPDGQPETVEHHTFDTDGDETSFVRERYTYDPLGRKSELVYDHGEGTDEELHYWMTWADPYAPGPTAESLDRDGAPQETWTITYVFRDPTEG